MLGIGTALPPHRLDPEAARELLLRTFSRLRVAELRPGTRYTVEPADRLLRQRPLGDAMRTYAIHAPRLAAEAARRAMADARVSADRIDMIVTVSCTGYQVPAMDVAMVAELGLRPDVIRMPITELGCSGGLSALGLAHRHVEARPDDRVLVVAVELCSLCFQPGDRSLDNLTASMVFGDGAGAVVVGGGGPPPGRTEVVASGRHLVPDTTECLGFDLRDDGFHIVLGSRLPKVLEARLAPIVRGFWAGGLPEYHVVHAGGPRVFDAVERALGLGPDALALSRHVFERVGNLSSASIIFALAELDEVGGDGLALAFGPGVTVELARLRRCRG
jgi:predicted naringenin-chalcone synthase